MKKLFGLSIPAILAVVFTPNVAHSKNPKVECLIGTWVPDASEIQNRLKRNSAAEQVKFSGSLSMTIREVNQLKGVEFRADKWSLFQRFKDSEAGIGSAGMTMVVDGSAKFSLSALAAGEFHFAEQSNDYTQKMLLHFKHREDHESKRDLTRELLPIGDWAHGTLECSSDVITFLVSSEDDDGYLSRTWSRQQ